jgi:hypothetical protein
LLVSPFEHVFVELLLLADDAALPDFLCDIHLFFCVG